MKNLTEVIKEVSSVEKTVDYNPAVLYRVYESNKLIYIGIGGLGKRKASGRLKEHYKAVMPSSFKWKILQREWLCGKSFNEAESVWDSLGWCYEIGTNDDIKMKEKELIKEYQPKYNIEFK
jgi:hypothetical protein